MDQLKSSGRTCEDAVEMFEDEPPSRATGFVVERRFFVRAAPIAVAALALGLPEKLSAEGRGRFRETASLDFDEFVKECAGLAKQAIADSSLNEEAHLFRLSLAASRLGLKGVPRGRLGRFGGLNPPVEFGPLHVAAPLAIIQWRLAPGATLPAHNHEPADIISLCIEGECTVRHFDIVGDAPGYSSGETFLIRETRNDLLTPGRMSSLSTARDNIHTFRAGKEGAWGIDINSILPGNKKFSFLDFADRPRDPQNRIYEAAWKRL
jgi:hypothetical protein